MEWLFYLLKVSACMGLFYTLYHLFLQKLTFFSANRFYLLLTLLLSFAIPAVQLEIERVKVATEIQNTINVTTDKEETQVIMIGSKDTNQSSSSFVDIWNKHKDAIISTTYWLIVLTVLLASIVQIAGLLLSTRKVSRKIMGLKVIYKTSGFTNCSFLSYVFLNKKDLTEEEMAVIIQHEHIHAFRLHSIDKLLVMICKALLWFNPFVYLYSKALEQMHEYEADKETSSAVGSTTNYANLLLSMAVRKNEISIVHSFAKNPLKERIKMLFTNPSKNMKKLIYLVSLPAVLVLVWLFGVQVVYAESKDNHITARFNAITLKNTTANKTDVSDKQEHGPVTIIKEEKLLAYEKSVADKNIVNITKKESLQNETVKDTIKLVGRLLGKNPTVKIDGKNYDPEILTKISPRCIRSTSTGGNSIDITTKDKKIIYATKTDIENVKAAIKAEKSDKFYVRYSQKDENGKQYDVVRLSKGGSTGSSDLAKGAKALIIINGKKYTEEQAKNLTEDVYKGFGSLSVVGGPSMALMYPEYAKEYEVVFQIPAPEVK